MTVYDFRFRMALQGDNRNQIIMIDVRHNHEGFVNKIFVKWRLDGVWNTSVDAWETSVVSPLVSFPFTSDVNVQVAFRNVNDTIQVSIKRIVYPFPTACLWKNNYRNDIAILWSYFSSTVLFPFEY